jgi:signal transduction histidine kinase
MIDLAKRKNNTKLHREFILIYTLLAIYLLALILQILFNGVGQIYFDYITYVAGVYLPVAFMALASTYLKPEFDLKKILWMLIVPTVTLIVLWTNDIHHLFFVKYSINISDGVVGPYFIVHSVYSYVLLTFALFTLIYASIRNSGFFSNQTALIVLGSMVPLFANVLGTFKIIPMTIYVTPVLFMFATICYAIAIFKYKALNITPIAFRTVIDTMSDAFIVISNDGTIVDKNLTFENIFKEILKANREDNLFEMIEKSNLLDLKDLKIHIKESRKMGSIIKEEYHIINKTFNKYFEVDIHPIKIKSNSEYIGTLLLFRDITQHKKDIQEIEDKQEVIVKQGQLVSIGELAGGVAHDINTPISAIKTGIQMLQEMYIPRDETEKELLFRMSNCTEKIIKIVNSMRNQIRNLGSDQKFNFKISEVIEDVRIIAYNEFQKSRCELSVNIEDDLSVYGDPTKLGQVFTNLFLNAIQAYNEKSGKIEVSVTKAPSNKIMVQVRDYAGGIPENIKEFVFKNILTTKGTKGTGLGLYLAYSVIKGEFSGEITFESSEGQGTTFYILLDRAKEESKVSVAQEINNEDKTEIK